MAPEQPKVWDELSSKEKVGRRLKSLRVASNLSQEQVALALDMSMVKVQRIERGEAALEFPDELERACNLFSVRFEEFMDPNFVPEPSRVRPFVLLTVGNPSPDLAARMKALVEDFNDEHVAKAEKTAKVRQAPPKSRHSRPSKNE
jgi:transcriptional regulator with XRE-family HTH domain